MSTEIALNERGLLRPTTMSEAMQFAEVLAKSTMVPREYQRMPANILVAIQMGAELGLAPLQALQSIAVVNGRPAVYGDSLMALVRSSPLCESVVETYEGEGDALTAVCIARRRGEAEPIVGRFSVADAKRAKLWGKAGPWTDYPKIMLKHRARGFCLRDGFADLLRGIISAEEAADHPREMKDVTPGAAVLGELNANLESALDAFAKSGGVEPDQAETDPLLAAAHSRALEGRASFGSWYMEISDPDRIALRPHIKELQAAARRVDDIADELPSPQPPAADRSREDLPPQPSPPEGAPADVVRYPYPPELHPYRQVNAPSHDEIERSQGMIGAVLGSEELKKLDESAAKAFHEDDIDVVKPKRGAGNRGWDWPLYAEELIAAARRVPVDLLGRFRGANSSMINALRTSNKEEWARVNQALADYERGEHA